MSRSSRAAALERTSTSVSFDTAAVVPSDGSSSHDSVLQELEIEFAEKVGQMRELADRLALRLEHNFQCEMFKLPKPVKKMRMREFCISYGGDVDEALKQQAKSCDDESILMPPPPRQVVGAPASLASTRGGKVPASAVPAAPNSARSKRPVAVASMGEVATETPSGKVRSTRSRVAPASTPSGGAAGKLMATPAASAVPSVAITPRIHETPRAMARGEVLLSTNGSPINTTGLNTIKARAGKRVRGASEAGPSILVSMADGSELDVCDRSAMKGLEADGEAKDLALAQLEQLQAQVQAHIEALKAPGGVPELP